MSVNQAQYYFVRNNLDHLQRGAPIVQTGKRAINSISSISSNQLALIVSTKKTDFLLITLLFTIFN